MFHGIVRLLGAVLLTASFAAAQPAPRVQYDAEFFPNAQHDPAVPTPAKLIGEDNGNGYHAATHAQIETCFRAWANNPRVKFIEYAKSHEGRTLFYVVITSPANQQKLDAIKADIAKLADPRNVAAGEIDRIVNQTPAPAWFSYNIHGDETSGADAAIQFAYHLIAATDDATVKLLDNHIICIDPCMNPDGRDRHLMQMRENRTTGVSLDDQALLATGYWPGGRMNHYLFDMNRDWIFATQPETRGRVREAGAWHPLLFVDAHEMGPQDTYLMSPPREAINPNYPKNRGAWNRLFQKDHAAAFDRNGWRHYAGEWNDNWYPGYSDAWASFRGAVGILYEQAHAGEDGIKLENGTTMPFRRAVHQQLTSSVANIETFAKNSRELMKQFAAERAENVSSEGKFAKRAWAIVPTANSARLNRLIETLNAHGVEVYRSENAAKFDGKDRLGVSFSGRELSAGTLIVPNRQPEAPLTSALLEFDTPFSEEILTAERREILRTGGSKIYDTTAWNLGMFFDLEVLEISGEVSVDGLKRVGSSEFKDPAAKATSPGEPTVGFVIDGASDDSVILAAKLMERDVKVRSAQRDFQFDGKSFSRGSIVIVNDDNQNVSDFTKAIKGISPTAVGINSGLGERGEDPTDPVDLGGEHFRLLQKPRIAVVGRDPFEAYSFGSTWHAIDHILGIRASYIDASNLTAADLRRYNVVVLPDSRGMSSVASVREDLKTWVSQGGTLIAFGDTAAELTGKDEKNKLSNVVLYGDALDKLADFEVQILREFEARTQKIDPAQIASHTLPATVKYFWGSLPERDKLDAEELKRRNDWQRTFNPQGAIAAARADDRHWLTFGCGEYVPVLINGRVPLMAGEGIDAPLRLGLYRAQPTPATAPTSTPATTQSSEKKDEAKPSTWARTPAGYELRLRMSGLLWPEAADRLANTAHVTRESHGRGQIILFAVTPTFRAATLGPQRVFLNALVHGPGCGASNVIP